MSGDIYLGRILGIPFRLHWSWFLAVFLIVWTLATGFFPLTLPQYHDERGLYWILGLLAALGLFGSVLLHELGHALAARRFGISVRGIRLFVFGGVAEFGSDPNKPSHEIVVAAAGPGVTAVLIVLFNLGLSTILATTGVGWHLEDGIIRLQSGTILEAGSAGLLFYLAFVNLILLVFNLIPAFPLDGGRVLRGVLWAATGNYLTSTRIAGAVGILFSYFLFLGGFLSTLGGNLVGGLWLFFLGMFLQNAAQSSIAYAQLQQLLRGVTVADLMNREPVTVAARQTLHEVVDQYFLRYPYKAYPVVEDGNFKGMLTLRAVQEVERERWDVSSAGDLVGQQEPLPALQPSQSALEAMRLLAENDTSRLPVVDGNSLVGLLSIRDLMDLVEIRTGLGLFREGGSSSFKRERRRTSDRNRELLSSQ